MTDAQAAGLAVVRREKCLACHLPNHASPTRAPDLSTAVGRLGAEKLAAVLVEGVPGTVMPRFDMPAADRAVVIEFLAWMQSHPGKVASVFASTQAEGGSPWALPWFEYE